MSEELRPCPFCGGEAELCYSEVDTFCRKCNVLQETELWNTRPIEDALRLRIAELEAEIECEMRVFKDGNAWCFVLPDFQDLQVSSSVWMKEGVLDKIYKELRSVRNDD